MTLDPVGLKAAVEARRIQLTKREVLTIDNLLGVSIQAYMDTVTCTWTWDINTMPDGWYVTSCGQDFAFTAGDMKANGVNFCHHCGKRAIEVKVPEITYE